MKDTYYSKTSFGLMGPLAVLYSLISNGFLRRIRFNYSQEQQFPLCAIKDDNRIERLAIVTGSNTGIGFETARQLVHSGYTVILACRSRDKGEAAAARINHSGEIHRKDHPTASALFVHPLDLSDFSSVRAFCKVVEGRRIHLLVNNAGINTTGRSADQLDLLFQSNFLGHFLLTSLLLPQLCGRIINLSSVMHHFCRSRVDGELNRAEFWKETAVTSSDNTYSLSKLAALLFTVALNERYPARRSIAVNPGAVNSDIWRAFPRFVIPIFSLIYLTNEQGCQTTIAAALQELPKDAVYLQPYWLPKSTKVPFPTMEMLGPFVQSRVTQPRLPGPDEGRTAAAALWEASAEITGASWPAPIK